MSQASDFRSTTSLPDSGEAAPPSLQDSIQFVRGVGPHRAELLARLELHTVEDVLWHLPKDVLDLTQITRPDELRADELQTVRGRVVDRDGKLLSNGRSMTAVLIESDGGYVRGVWFNQDWVLRKFQQDQFVLFSGKPKRRSGRWEITHPRVQWLEGDDGEAHGGVLPRYGLTEGLAMHEMRRIARTVAEDYSQLMPELLPEPFRKKVSVTGVAAAFRGVHRPASIDEFQAGWRRLIFQDLLEFQVGLAVRRRAWRNLSAAPKCPVTAKIDARIRRLLPFELTAGQNRAIREIAADLESGWAMHRLLQADVGAGKTVVAIYAMLAAVAAGYQTVLMAPTEILARQHWGTLERLLQQSRVNRCLLTGQISSAERQQALASIRSGEMQLVVGTQAVIQKDVAFARLGMAVIDEQHKFGVLQRAHFSGDDRIPHTLVMTATPIPRSLCLTQFGDLELSVISELPPGRQKVITSRVATPQVAAKAWEFIRGKLTSGRQAYVVCPRIEAGGDPFSDETGDFRSVETAWRQLSQGELREFRVGLLHGQLPPAEKQATMEAFQRGELQVLVSTTVIEVGIDVPNATLMVIFEADRFGLSQLHQLRGRITRGHFQGYCFLFPGAGEGTPEGAARLAALEAHASGFDIAEADFALRGPGDVLGTRQHGALPLRVADLVRDQAVLLEARSVAFELVSSGELDTPEFAALKRQVLDRFGKLLEIAGAG